MTEHPVPPVQIVGDRLRVVWSDFSAGAGYELFKAVKRLPEYDVVLDDDGLSCGVTSPARFAGLLGVAAPQLQRDQIDWPAHFSPQFDDQPAITQMGLDAKRFACWSDCGLGKTVIGLEFARQVNHLSRGGRVLIVTLNEIVPQWIEEAKKFYGDTLPVVRLNSREEMRRWCATGSTNVTDYATSARVEMHGVRQTDSAHDQTGKNQETEKDEKKDGQRDHPLQSLRAPNDFRAEPASAKLDATGKNEASESPVCGTDPAGSGANHQSHVGLTASIAVVNYEKFNHDSEADQVVSELRHLAGIVLDESSRLKTGGGKQKWALIKSARGIEYKLSLTATPAPNELMEFASQASFLERMRSESIANATHQIIWTYFTRDPKTHRWTIKKHARAAFFEWMASWSIYVRNPKAFGWRLDWAPPPEPVYLRHEIPITPEQRQLIMDFNADARNVAEANVGSMFAGEMNAIVATKLSQAAKGFLYQKSGVRSQKTEGKPKCRESAQKIASRVSTISAAAAETASVAAVTCSTLANGAVRSLALNTTSTARANPTSQTTTKTMTTLRSIRPVHSLKPAFVADLIVSEMLAGHQVLVWTVFDEEIAVLFECLKRHPKISDKSAKIKLWDIDALTGKTSDADRLDILNDFRSGQCRTLISRASMLGYGMNLQFVTSMIFSGWSFSYEQFYQAVRRAFRHGQQQAVRVHLPVIPELEGQMYDAIVRKQKQHEEAIAEMEGNYVKARQQLTGGKVAV